MQKDGDLAANYKGAFDGHLSFGSKPCLLIIDFVQVCSTTEEESRIVRERTERYCTCSARTP